LRKVAEKKLIINNLLHYYIYVVGDNTNNGVYEALNGTPTRAKNL
jgi:hypothetical protein